MLNCELQSNHGLYVYMHSADSTNDSDYVLFMVFFFLLHFAFALLCLRLKSAIPLWMP